MAVNNPHASDQHLVSQFQQGDEAAFVCLLKKYHAKLLRLIRMYISDRGLAEDVLQEVELKIYNALPKFEGRSNFYTWAYRITVNTAKNRLAFDAIRVPLVDVDHEDALFVSNRRRGLQEPESPDRLLAKEELEAQIAEILSSMPEELAEVIVLREFENLPYQVIAEIERCPVGTVRSRLHRAREFLLKRLG